MGCNRRTDKKEAGRDNFSRSGSAAEIALMEEEKLVIRREAPGEGSGKQAEFSRSLGSDLNSMG